MISAPFDRPVTGEALMPLDRVRRPFCVSLAIRMAGERPLSSWFKTYRGAVSLACAEL